MACYYQQFLSVIAKNPWLAAQPSGYRVWDRHTSPLSSGILQGGTAQRWKVEQTYWKPEQDGKNEVQTLTIAVKCILSYKMQSGFSSCIASHLLILPSCNCLMLFYVFSYLFLIWNMPAYRKASQSLSENSNTPLFLGTVQQLWIPSKLKPPVSDSQLHPARV